MTTIDDHWNDLVTAALLGTDRREPPTLPGPLADLVADAVRPSPSARMLAQVAACTAVRRAAVMPAEPAPRLQPPDVDERPIIVPAAVDRWHHITTSWPVLEDEWLVAVIQRGWRIAPDLVPALLWRHRTDPVRRARVVVAAGPVADWLVDQLPNYAGRTAAHTVDPAAIVELPDLPIPPELLDLLHRPGASVGRAIGEGLEAGRFGEAHRAVLVNLLARIAPAGCTAVAEVVGTVDSYSPGYGLATVLADLAITRHRMLDELSI